MANIISEYYSEYVGTKEKFEKFHNNVINMPRANFSELDDTIKLLICDFIHRIIRSSFNPEKISIFWLLIALNTALINYINLDTIKNDYEKAKSYTMQYYDIFNG